MEATVSIIYLVLITYCLVGLFIIIPYKERKEDEDTRAWTDRCIASNRADFPKRMKLLKGIDAKMIENMQKPPLWVSMIKKGKK